MKIWRTDFVGNPDDFPDIPLARCLVRESKDLPQYRLIGRLRKETFSLFKYTISGKGCLKYNDEVYELTAGSAFVCNVNDPRIEYYIDPNHEEPWEFIYLTFWNGRAIADVLLEQFKVFKLAPDNSFIQRIGRYSRFNNNFISTPPADNFSLVADLIKETLNSLPVKHDDKGNIICIKAKEFISKNINQAINVTDIAKNLRISAVHLSRLFHTHMGEKVIDYLNRIKIEYAKSELMNSPLLSVKEIAVHCGYNNASHFSRLFKKQTGLTPNNYRTAKVIDINL